MTVILLHLLTLAVGAAGGYVYAWATLTRTRRSAVSEHHAPSWLRSPVPANVGLIAASIFLAVVAVVTYVGKQQDAAQNDRLCAVVDDMGRTLRGRTLNYEEKARADLRWKQDLLRELKRIGGGDSAFTRSTTTSANADRDYLEHLRANPVTRVRPEDCQ